MHWGFSYHSRIFHSLCRRHHYRWRWRAANFDLCLPFIEQWMFFSVPHTPTVTRGISLLCLSPRTRDTNTYCRAFGSGAVITCFNDLGLSRPGIEPRSSACKANALPIRHRRRTSLCIMCWPLMNSTIHMDEIAIILTDHLMDPFNNLIIYNKLSKIM